MTVKINMFLDQGDTKLVTLQVIHNNQSFFISRNIDIADGKTTEQYISEAYTAAEDEINAWKADINIVGRDFDETTGNFVNNGD